MRRPAKAFLYNPDTRKYNDEETEGYVLGFFGDEADVLFELKDRTLRWASPSRTRFVEVEKINKFMEE